MLLGSSVGLAAPARADAPPADQQTARFEVDFLTGMIDHHTMAITMSENCLERATHQELRALCQSVIETQAAEIEQMQAWLAGWYGVSYEPQLSTGDMRSMRRLERLSGAEYEVRFMRSLIRHHWAAIREAESCLDQAEHSALRELCQDIRSVQLQEIATLQEWLADWYDRRGGRPVDTAA